MDGIMPGDFDELGALLVGERSGQLNVEVDPIDFSFFSLAILAVDRVDF